MTTPDTEPEAEPAGDEDYGPQMTAEDLTGPTVLPDFFGPPVYDRLPDGSTVRGVTLPGSGGGEEDVGGGDKFEPGKRAVWVCNEGPKPPGGGWIDLLK